MKDSVRTPKKIACICYGGYRDEVFHIILHIHVSGGGPCAPDMDGALGPIRRNDSIAKVGWFSALNARCLHDLCSLDGY